MNVVDINFIIFCVTKNKVNLFHTFDLYLHKIFQFLLISIAISINAVCKHTIFHTITVFLIIVVLCRKSISTPAISLASTNHTETSLWNQDGYPSCMPSWLWFSLYFFFLEKFLGAEYRRETEMFSGSRRALLLRSKRDVHAESTSGVKRVIREDGGFALNSRPECRRV